MSSLLHLIQRSEWQFFITCTFKNSRTMSAKARHSMQYQFMRRLAAMDKGERRGEAALRDLRFIIREELGEQTNRLHWHALVSGIKPSLVRSTTCLFMMGYWEGIGGGMSRIRVFDDAQDGSSYITKGLESELAEWNHAGANRYEVGKFNGDDTLMLIPSAALLADWKRAAAVSRGLTRLHRTGAELPAVKLSTQRPDTSKAGADIREDGTGGELFPWGNGNQSNGKPGHATRTVVGGLTPVSSVP